MHSPIDWKPRSSKVGGYFACDYRAMLDRAIAEGRIPSYADEGEKPYADFGTLCHYQMMMDMGLEFPDGKECPSATYVEAAKSLFGGSEEKLYKRMKVVSELGQSACPAPPEGEQWLAETHYKQTFLSGSIDFISSDGSVIGDLKTTSRKPDHGRIKPSHLYQLLCYCILAEKAGAVPERAWVLYVASTSGDWTCLVEFDLNTTHMRHMRSEIVKYIKFLRSNKIWKHAVPRLGSHCEGDFCEHTARCRKLIMPEPGTSSTTKTAPAIVMTNPFGTAVGNTI